MRVGSRIICALFSISGLLLASADSEQRQQAKHEEEPLLPPTAPKDYAHLTTNSRVKDLVGFFELLDKSGRDAKLAQKTSVILSLSESATKLYTLAHGLALDVRCHRYVRLISLPDIRSVATISALMEESPSLSELVQSDANLVAHLTNERNLEAIARIQTIIQTLESERTLGKSNFEPNVEKELLDCISYYVYRHQRATSNVVQYVRDSVASLAHSLIEPTESKVFVDKFRKPIELIEKIENETSQGPFDYQGWLRALMELRTLAVQSDFEIPLMVRDFLASTDRSKRLELWLESDELTNTILLAEPHLSWFNKNSEANEAHRRATLRLHYLCSQGDKQMEPPHGACALLEDPRRSKIVEELAREREVKRATPDSTHEADRPPPTRIDAPATNFAVVESAPDNTIEPSSTTTSKAEDLKTKINEKSKLVSHKLSSAANWIDQTFDDWWKPLGWGAPKLQVKAGKLNREPDNNLLLNYVA